MSEDPKSKIQNPQSGLSFYRDANGDPRADGGSANQLLAGFLESEIQGSMKMCSILLDAVDRVTDGSLEEWEESGNAHTISLARQGARIEPLFDDSVPAIELSLDKLRDTVLRWKAFIEQ